MTTCGVAAYVREREIQMSITLVKIFCDRSTKKTSRISVRQLSRGGFLFYLISINEKFFLIPQNYVSEI